MNTELYEKLDTARVQTAKAQTKAGKYYHGWRDLDGTAHVRVVEEGGPRQLALRLDLFNHSPTGFEWGYAGSGPAQLALAILADALGDDQKAVRYHQKFKFLEVNRMPHDGWLLLAKDVSVAQWEKLDEQDQKDET